METNTSVDRVRFTTHPSRYKHWKLEIDGPVAWFTALSRAMHKPTEPSFALFFAGGRH